MSSVNLQKQLRTDVVMDGLCGAGKTTVLKVLKYGKLNPANMRSTIGTEFEDVSMNGITLRVWDFGACSSYRALVQFCDQTAKSFVFAIDSTDQYRVVRAGEDLHRMKAQGRLQDKPILILANKQDLSNAMSVDQIREKLALDKFDETVVWHLQGTSAIQNTGIQEGFTWLANRFVTTTTVSNNSVSMDNNNIICALL